MNDYHYHYIIYVKSLTFPQLPGINVWLAEVGHPASIKLLIGLNLPMGVGSGNHRSCR